MPKPTPFLNSRMFEHIVERVKTDPTISPRTRELTIALFRMERLQLWLGNLGPFLRKTGQWFLAFAVQICIVYLVQTLIGFTVLQQWELMGVIGLVTLAAAVITWVVRRLLLGAMRSVFEATVESAFADDTKAGRLLPPANVVPFQRPTGGPTEPPTSC